MSRGAWVLLACGVACGVALGGCARRAEVGVGVGVEVGVTDGRSAPSRAPATDTLRGTVRLVGSEPGLLVLEATTGAVSDVTGASLDALRAAEGLEVMLVGRAGAPTGLTPSRIGFDIVRFAVRRAAGVPAIDGILVRTGESFALRLVDGTVVPLTYMPEGLRGAVGARIYLAGPLDDAPRAYGVLAAAP